jgi:hypothetical protein
MFRVLHAYLFYNCNFYVKTQSLLTIMLTAIYKSNKSALEPDTLLLYTYDSHNTTIFPTYNLRLGLCNVSLLCSL